MGDKVRAVEGASVLCKRAAEARARALACGAHTRTTHLKPSYGRAVGRVRTNTLMRERAIVLGGQTLAAADLGQAAGA